MTSHLLLSLLFLSASTQPPADLYAGRAYSRGGEICFDLPEGLVDWGALGKAALGAEGFDRPSPETLRKYPYFESGGSSNARFEAPVPPQVSDRVWQVLHENGFQPLRPKVLRGEVIYNVNRSFEVLGPPAATGQACGAGSRDKGKAAFVLSGGTAGGWSFAPVKASAEAPGRFAIEFMGSRYRFENPDFAVPRLQKVLVFRSEGSRPLALAVWEADPRCEVMCCEASFSLFALGPEGALQRLEDNGYDCDV
ncbi:MAG TPA: hypothetical protein VF756_30690 [Thermoanaerobaculia bacterium]